ncbi:hypothetical protein RTP6_000450 [Batrachochytrium dendrobatidis]
MMPDHECSPTENTGVLPDSKTNRHTITRDDNTAADINHYTISLGKPRRLTALVKKAISYQQRQWFTNLCCISACPLLMVLVSTLLGNLIVGLISSLPSEEYLLCSNSNSSDMLNVPIWANNDPRLPLSNGAEYPKATEPTVINTNWGLAAASHSVDIRSMNSKRSCVYWYGESYPFNASSIYEAPPGVSGNFVRDSAYLSTPLGGWTNVIRNSETLVRSNQRDVQQSQTSIGLFFRSQKHSWAVYGADPSVDLNLIGVKNSQPKVPAIQFLTSPTKPVFESPQDGDTGILGTIPTRHYIEQETIFVNTSLSAIAVPWFLSVPGDGLSIDNYISSSIHQIIDEIANLNRSAILEARGRSRTGQRLQLEISKILFAIPHGGIYFRLIDHKKRQYAFDMHFGTDIRLSSSARFASTGDRMLLQLTQLTNGIMRNSDIPKLGRARITQGLRIFPEIQSSKIVFSYAGLIGSILFPFGVSFLLPIFVIILIQEKENRIFVVMKMNGVTPWSYYATHYLTFYVLYAISVFIFIVSGYISKQTFFTLTHLGVLVILFFIWGHNQISLTFFFAAFFQKSRNALVVVFLIVLGSIMISLALGRIFKDGSKMPLPFFIWPPFAFYRALSQINTASYVHHQQPYKIWNLVPGDEVFSALMFMICEIPIFLGFAGYLSAVLPSDFGVSKSWHFPITDLIRAMRQLTRSRSFFEQDHVNESSLALSIDTNETETEDDDVKAERLRIDRNEHSSKSPIVIRHMRKVYRKHYNIPPKIAVRDVTFAVEEGVVFGLLGPNGAGKTTLFSILTGLYEASSGSAQLAGFDISTDMDQMHKRIGICPQFDILWGDLTINDHLYFYSRLKGVSSQQENQAVQKALNDVSLEKLAHRQIKGLSGGEKRRLSIAIALLGDPKVVFLDEPTTGLDPEVRRLIWSIINKARVGKTIVLTTHSMEEAEALCQRISIMARGSLRCIANPIRLKQLYGSGYRLYFNCHEHDMERASTFIESVLPEKWILIGTFATNASYEFPSSGGNLTKLFKTIEGQKAHVGILDWGVGQTTLEEVFFRLISDNDVDSS